MGMGEIKREVITDEQGRIMDPDVGDPWKPWPVSAAVVSDNKPGREEPKAQSVDKTPKAFSAVGLAEEKSNMSARKEHCDKMREEYAQDDTFDDNQHVALDTLFDAIEADALYASTNGLYPSVESFLRDLPSRVVSTCRRAGLSAADRRSAIRNFLPYTATGARRAPCKTPKVFSEDSCAEEQKSILANVLKFVDTQRSEDRRVINYQDLANNVPGALFLDNETIMTAISEAHPVANWSVSTKHKITTKQVFVFDGREFPTLQRAEAYAAYSALSGDECEKQVVSLADEIAETTNFGSDDLRQVLYTLLKMGATLPPALED